MLGAIAGDVIGSPYERHQVKTTIFPLFQDRSRFTDDTVMTVAVASVILDRADYATTLRSFGRQYPRAGYGRGFSTWIHTADAGPYGSWGNGSAMRVSPIGFAFESADEVLDQAQRSAEVTHNHPEGIKGAQATALAVFLARTGWSKENIRAEIGERFGYDLSRSLGQIRPTYRFDVSCQGSVPEAIIAFLESNDFEGAIRNAVSLGGDSDTQACIAGGIAQAYYKSVPAKIVEGTRSRLPAQFLDILDRFDAECFQLQQT